MCGWETTYNHVGLVDGTEGKKRKQGQEDSLYNGEGVGSVALLLAEGEDHSTLDGVDPREEKTGSTSRSVEKVELCTGEIAFVSDWRAIEKVRDGRTFS